MIYVQHMGAPTDHIDPSCLYFAMLLCDDDANLMADSMQKTVLVPGKSTPVVFQTGPILA